MNMVLVLVFGAIFLFVAIKFYDKMEEATRKHVITAIKDKIWIIDETCTSGNRDSIKLYSEIMCQMALYGIKHENLSPYNLTTVRDCVARSYSNVIHQAELALRICMEHLEDQSLDDSEGGVRRKAELQVTQRNLQDELGLMRAELSKFLGI